MNRRSLLPLAVLSAVCTAVILGSGGSSGSPGAVAQLALAHRVVEHYALPAAPAATTAPAAVSAPAASTPAPAPAADTTSVDDATASDAAVTDTATTTTTTTTPSKTTAAAAPKPSSITHVALIALNGPDEATTFGATSAAPYLAGTLRKQGVLLSGFHPLTAAALPNAIAAIGGQPPNPDTEQDCPTYAEFPPTAAPSNTGVVPGTGCVYPNSVITLGDQLTASRDSWRAYIGGMGTQTCSHPDSAAADATATTPPADGYLTRANPFVYYHSLLDLGDCQADDHDLTALTDDLKTVKTTPSFSYIAPDACASGAVTPCPDGTPGGLAASDAFLKTWVPALQAAPAFKHHSLIVIAFLSATGATMATTPPSTGALLLSSDAHANALDGRDADPYALLRSVEDVFGLKPLAKAAKATGFAATDLKGAFAG